MTPSLKNLANYRTQQRSSDFHRSFETTQNKENRHEIWQLDCGSPKKWGGVGLGFVDRFVMAQGNEKLWALAKAVINLRVP